MVGATATPGWPDVVRRAGTASVDALRPHVERDWTVVSDDLGLPARDILEHVLEGLLFYARDLATPVVALGDDELTLVPADGATVASLVEGMRQTACVVAAVVAATPDDVRAFHPWGSADASGFAAMACDEMLVHTDDAARTLGADFEPPADVCERVLERLFPWAPADGPAWERLRWANGRTALGGRARLEGWRWHAAPVDEWDGEMPDFVVTSGATG